MPVKLDGVRYFSNDEVAQRLGISRQTLWRWRASGKIPVGHQYRGREVLFTQEEVNEVQRYAHRMGPAVPKSATQLPLFNNGKG